MPAGRATEIMPNDTSQTPGFGQRDNQEPDLITKVEFANRTSLSIRSVEKLLNEQRIPVIRLSRKMVRIPYAEAMEHLRKTYQVNAR